MKNNISSLLPVGKHYIVVQFGDEDNIQYSKAFMVTVKDPQAKDTISLTLKKVKVKKSAKKIVLQATLKINKKAKKGLKVVFKFNGKKVGAAKTGKKGIAKITLKNKKLKKLLKKVKAGKKIKIKATYGNTTAKISVKVKR